MQRFFEVSRYVSDFEVLWDNKKEKNIYLERTVSTPRLLPPSQGC
jgi:hypothetical protein